MSFDLAVMNIDANTAPEKAAEFYDQLCDGDYSVLPPSDRVDAFYRELVDRYPDIDSYADDDVDDCPWSVEVDVSDGAVVMCIVWSRAGEVAPFVVGLAAKHGLACYDPQEGKVL